MTEPTPPLVTPTPHPSTGLYPRNHFLVFPYTITGGGNGLFPWSAFVPQGDFLRVADKDLDGKMYVSQIGHDDPKILAETLLSAPLDGGPLGGLVYLTIQYRMINFSPNHPPVRIRIFESSDNLAGAPVYLEIPSEEHTVGDRWKTAVLPFPYRPELPNRRMNLQLRHADNPGKPNCRVEVSALYLTSYTAVSGNTPIANASGPVVGALTGSGSVRAQVGTVSPLRVDCALTATGFASAVGATAVRQGFVAAQSVVAPSVVPNSAASAALRVDVSLTATGFTATSTVSARDALTGILSAAGAFLPSTAIGSAFRVDCAMSVSGFASVQSRTGSGSLRGFSSTVADARPVTGLTGTLRAAATSSATGRTATGTATARDALTATVTATGRVDNRFPGSAAFRVDAAILATGTANVQVVTAVAEQASAIQGTVQAVLVTVGRAVTETLTRLRAEGIDATATAHPQEQGITASVRAASNPAGVAEGSADLFQEVTLRATSPATLRLGPQPPIHFTGFLDVDPAGLPSGTGFVAAAARLIASGVAGPATSGVVWNPVATARLALDAAKTLVTQTGHSGNADGTSALLCTDFYVTSVPTFVNFQAGATLTIDKTASLFQPPAESQMIVQAVFGLTRIVDAYEAPTVEGTRSSLTMRGGSSLDVTGHETGVGTAVLLGGGSIRCEATLIPLTVADFLSTLHLRAEARLTAQARIGLFTFYAQAFLTQTVEMSALAGGGQATSVAVTLSATAGSLTTASYTPPSTGQGAANLACSTAMRVEGYVRSVPLVAQGRVTMETFTTLDAPGPLLFNQPAASTIGGVATVVIEPGARGALEEGVTFPLAVTSRVTANGQQRVTVGMIGRARMRIEADVFVAALGSSSAAASSTIIALGSASGNKEFGAGDLAVHSGLDATLIQTVFADSTAALAARARFVARPPDYYGGADLKVTSRLDRTHPGRVSLKVRVRFAVVGTEGIPQSGSRVEQEPPRGGFTIGPTTGNASPAGGTTGSPEALPAVGPPPRVRTLTGNTNARGGSQ